MKKTVISGAMLAFLIAGGMFLFGKDPELLAMVWPGDGGPGIPKGTYATQKWAPRVNELAGTCMTLVEESGNPMLVRALKTGKEKLEAKQWQAALTRFEFGSSEAPGEGDDQRRRGCFYSYIARTYQDMGRSRDAARFFSAALSAFKKTDDHALAMETMETLFGMGPLNNVTRYEQMKREIPDYYLRLADARLAEKRYKDAALNYRQSINFHTTHGKGAATQTVPALIGLGMALEAQENIGDAAATYQEALKQAEAAGDVFNTARATSRLGWITYQSGSRWSGRSQLKKAASQLEALGKTESDAYTWTMEKVLSTRSWPDWVPFQDYLPG